MASYSTIPADATSGTESMSSSTASLRGRRPRRGIKDTGMVGQASWISSVINLMNTILGAGLLAMPKALSQLGILLGVFVIVWAGLTAGFGLYLQTRCARYIERGSASFASLSKLTYPNLSCIFDAAIAIKCFGVGVSYLIIIGDLMPGVVRAFTSADDARFLIDRQFWITAFMLVIIPLSFLRRLDSLKYTSIVALTSICYLAILVIAHFIKGDTIPDRGHVNVVQWSGPLQALSVFPVIVFAYTCHQNMFSILNEIYDNSHFRSTAVIFGSIGSACLLYITVGITGYLSYGDKVTGNIVSMYNPSAATTIGRLAIVVLVMFSFPLQCHPCRASINAVLGWRPIRANSPNETSPSRTSLITPHPLSPSKAAQPKEISEVRFAVITTIIIVLSYIVAMSVNSLEKVLAYVGSTGSTTISFILPGLFYYKISSPDSPHHQRLVKEDDDEFEDDIDEVGDVSMFAVRSSRHWRQALLRKASLALAIYGACVMVVCLLLNTFWHVGH